MQVNNHNTDVVILGGGWAGLSAGCVLARAGRRVMVFESDTTVGGLSKTIVKGDFRFDLGGHRFFTKDKSIERFVEELMEGELEMVSRSSKIYLRNKFFDYPLKPSNAAFGLGLLLTARILLDYGAENLKNRFRKKECISLEDWVVSQFGRTMFNIYFKEYSEKVWGIDCSRISAEWVAKRIQGLSLSTAIKNAFFKFSGKGIPTLADRFLYPSLGIGRISDRLQEIIDETGKVFTGARVEHVYHSGSEITGVTVRNSDGAQLMEGRDFVSSIPMTSLVKMLHPRAPEDVLNAASRLRFRDLVIVTVMVNREQVTDQTWIYLPEGKLALGRLHEPKNWSPKMAPAAQTLLVTEHFCFAGDQTWNTDDARLVENTVQQLELMGFITKKEVVDSAVVRVPKAYPLLEVGYREHYEKLWQYLTGFRNLHVIGRSGTFRYLNMDHAIESGVHMAEKLISIERENVLQVGQEERMILAGEAR